jgi:hypothetical protein
MVHHLVNLPGSPTVQASIRPTLVVAPKGDQT